MVIKGFKRGFALWVGSGGCEGEEEQVHGVEKPPEVWWDPEGQDHRC